MKTNRKIAYHDVLIWANEARLDLPDRWESIQQNLPPLQKTDIATNDHRILHHQPITSNKRYLLACAGLAVLLLAGGLFVSGLLEQWFWPAYSPGDHYTPMTTQSGASTESGKPTASASTFSSEQLAFSDQANAQFALMEQAHIPDQYAYYAGCFIENNLQTFVINVTCNPRDFQAKYADLLDFRMIEVRQVKYTLKELKMAYEPLQQAFLGSDKLTKLGVIGMAVHEQNNAILIVVQEVNDKVRKAAAEIVPDTGMVVFEVGEKITPY